MLQTSCNILEGSSNSPMMHLTGLGQKRIRVGVAEI